ncbi:hypothetical protein [Amycolatopsis pigmentata]|uniref:Uncharacterized protein n=1 Tax=Amycolatopsis pigmentata TaxID=450801 RepID=A0ABW5FU04_9PSEU
MKETVGLPEWRLMPEGLRDRLWVEIEPRLETRASDSWFRTMRAPLAVAASVVVLAAGAAIGLPRLRDQGGTVSAGAGSPSDVQLVNECVQATHQKLRPALNWRAGARIDVDPENGFLVVRNDDYAAICNLKNGKGEGIDYSVETRQMYGNLSAARPVEYGYSSNFDYLAKGSLHFGIVTDDVVAVSLIGPRNSATPAVVRDGTFLAETKFGEAGASPFNRIRATLKSGQVYEGPLR